MRRALLALSALLLPLALAAHAGDWWNWRGPTQNGVSPETDLPASWAPDKVGANNLIWKAPYGCRSTPLVMNGHVYFINYSAEKVKGKDKSDSIQERVVCLDADTGKLVWEHKFNVWHTDIVTVRLGWTNLAGDPKTGKVYAHGTQGLLTCFDKKGKILWQHSMSEEFGRFTGYGGRVTSPVVDEDLVILGMVNSAWGDFAKGANRYVAFNKDTGEVVWWSEQGGQPKDTYYSVPVVATIHGQRLVISGGSDGGVYAMKARTGESAWSYVFGTAAVNCSPVVDGKYVYIGHGEENPDNNVQGRVVCLDASQIENGEPKLVWQKDGLKARYTSPIVHQGRLYITDDAGRLYCFDAVKGKRQWEYDYGRDSRGSPVLADGKIYVGEVNSKFHILKPGPKKCEALHEQLFLSADGVSDVEINGSAAVANGRVYFATSEEMYCIGKNGKQIATPSENLPPAQVKPGPITHLQVLPAEVTLHPGESVQFRVRGFDANGNFVKEVQADEWSIVSPAPPGKQPPPPLDGDVKSGKLTVSPKKASQQGYVMAKAGEARGKARVRVAPVLPYAQDFEKLPDGAAPGGWVNTQGKFKVVTLKGGNKVLAKVNNNPSPLIARGNAYIGTPDMRDYTIECDVQGSRVGEDMPDMGVVANRYSLYLAGNIQRLRLNTWSALPRVDRTIPFAWQPGVWYRLKLTTEIATGKAVVKGKCWPRDMPEPQNWTVELTDPYPNTEGTPALYGYVQGIPEGGAGTDIYFDNVQITPNRK
jgi:outer membrane protein assembly factor BamB